MYRIPAKNHQTELVIKKSRFIARASLATNRERAMAFVQSCREIDRDASHHCWAYQFGSPDSPRSAAMSDDGEPSGTAGKPILNVIQHKDVGDIVVVVSRYFGGVKLGAGGLIRAYSGAAQLVMETLSVKELVVKARVAVSLDFSQEQELRHWLSTHRGNLVSTEYDEQVTCLVELPEQELDTLDELALQRQWKINDSQPQ